MVGHSLLALGVRRSPRSPGARCIAGPSPRRRRRRHRV